MLSPQSRAWKIVILLLAIILAVYLLSGIYTVKADERAVIRRFGKVTNERVKSGIHFRWRLVEKINKLKLKETKRLSVGFEVPDEILGQTPDPFQVQFMTGDKNIIEIQMILQYQIRDPKNYLFNAADVEALVRRSAEALLSEKVAGMLVDDVLVYKKLSIQMEVKRQLQSLLNDRYNCGAQIVSVNLKKVSAPPDVMDAFNDAQRAKADRDRIINEAYGYESDIIPKARGEADKLLRGAEAYFEERQNQAQGDVDRFNKMLAEYKKAKDVTSLRLYIESMEEILPRLKKILVDSSDNSPIDLGILEK